VIEPYSEKNLFLKDKPKRPAMGERTWVPTKTERLPERLYTPLRYEIKHMTLPRILAAAVVRSLKATHSPHLD
jgi:hypothetical protein